ncbi:MAG: methionine--tRNA ligase [Bdellovibrionales bacterium]
MSKRQILVTAGLPYANGEIHLGHLVEYLQADFWTRFQNMQGHDCKYFCADDTHGTPIMVAARKKGISPEDLISQALEKHIKDFDDFGIEFSNFSSTNTDTNKKLCQEMFLKIEKAGHINKKSVNQSFCEHDNMFLPDRFVKGTCPKCGAEEQYGDSCDNCSATYNPTDLKDPACSICGNSPIEKASDHIFFQLNDFKAFLEDWLKDHTSKEVSNKMLEWFEEDLRDWDISRDAPYFGFEIPGNPGKYFYVWVDAPIGYMASAKEYCDSNDILFEDYWKKSEIYHFIGKDIVYFHTLFWPAMLKAANMSRPDGVFVHGMLTVNGVKMSKSKGTFINARTYLKHLDPIFLRYYYACKFNSSMEDVDLNLEDFVSRVNSDLIGKITNLASRGAQMLQKRLDGKMGLLDPEGEKILELARSKSELIAGFYESREFSKANTAIREIADECNRYFDEKAPWKLIKEDEEETRKVLSSTLNVFRVLAIYLKPVLPDYAAKVEKLFGEEAYSWNDMEKTLVNIELQKFEHLAVRLDPKNIDAMVEDSKSEEKPKDIKKHKKTKADAPQEIEFDQFMSVDLRVAKIVSAEHIDGADKLLRLQLDIGEEKTRQVFAGIKSAYDPETLVGRQTVMVANLKARKMKFGMSEGMVLAAGQGGKELFILSPDDGAKPGDRVK